MLRFQLAGAIHKFDVRPQYCCTACAASPDITARYIEATVSYCESLRTFPRRAAMRDGVRPDLRITHCKRHTVTAFAVDAEQVSIIGMFCGGLDDETILQDDNEDGEAR